MSRVRGAIATPEIPRRFERLPSTGSTHVGVDGSVGVRRRGGPAAEATAPGTDIGFRTPPDLGCPAERVEHLVPQHTHAAAGPPLCGSLAALGGGEPRPNGLYISAAVATTGGDANPRPRSVRRTKPGRPRRYPATPKSTRLPADPACGLTT